MAIAVPVADATRRFTSQPRQLLIGGEWVDAADGETFETIDPGTGEVLTHRRPRQGRGHRPRRAGSAPGPRGPLVAR